MKVIYCKTMLQRISEAALEADVLHKTIDVLELTDAEWDQMRREVGNTLYGPFGKGMCPTAKEQREGKGSTIHSIFGVRVRLEGMQ